MIDEGRRYHDNGKIRCIRPLVDGVPHGIHQEWYPNGVLKEETPFNHGIIDGTVKYWDDKGKLLGASEINNGTGVLHYWISEQEMRGEGSYVDGKLTGRWVSYLGGELGRIQYWLENKKVSRKRYDEACKHNPKFPRYGDDRELGPTWLQKAKKSGQIKPAKPREVTDDLPLRLLQGEGVREALTWLQKSRQPSRWLGEATDQEDSIDLVKRLYRLGAVSVNAVEIQGEPQGEQSTGRLVIELPKEKRSRAKLLRLCGKLAEQHGFDPMPDAGQRYLFLMLD
jgi:hypothetical protein